MNEIILCVMDRKNKTKAELVVNERAAEADWAAAAWGADSEAVYEAAEAAWDAAWAAWDAAWAAWEAKADIDRHINRYFEISGESRADYKKELEVGK